MPDDLSLLKGIKLAYGYENNTAVQLLHLCHEEDQYRYSKQSCHYIVKVHWANGLQLQNMVIFFDCQWRGYYDIEKIVLVVLCVEIEGKFLTFLFTFGLVLAH